MAGAKKMGDMLKEAGLIDDFQLQSALSHQRNWGGKLGSILIELELVREEDIARVMSDFLRIPHIDLFEPEIPEAVTKTVKAEIAKKYHVIPVKKEGGALVLAMFDPLDIEAMDEIRFITGLNIKPSLAMESEIKDAIRKYYDHEDVVRTHAKKLFHQSTESAGKMELLRGSDLLTPKGPGYDPESPVLSREEAAKQSLADDAKIRLDALVSVLIEKKLITREELTSMIYQKKMGL
jgi:hypothetical protein